MDTDQKTPCSSQAAVFQEPGQPFDLRPIPLPALKAGEVLVRVVCCTICGSDLHTYQGHRSCKTPCVLGHEIIGRVEGWGGNVTPRDFHGKPVSIGQRVTWSLAVGCGGCFYCTNGIPQKCTSLFKYGHESIVPSLGPTGGLAEFVHLVAGTSIFALPDELPDLVAAPANCATATVAGALRLAAETQPLQNRAALVTGLGLLGLTACAMLRQGGVREVIAIDMVQERVVLSRSFGATQSVHASDLSSSLKSVIAECTDGRGVDLAFEFAGAPTAITTCLEALRVGGTAIFVGSVFPSDGLMMQPEDVVRRMLTIRGLHNYRPCDLDTGLIFLTEKHLSYPFAALVSESFSLPESDRAFEHAIRQKPVRVAVTGEQKAHLGKRTRI